MWKSGGIKSGTRTTPASMKQAVEGLRESDCTQALAIKGLTVSDPPGRLSDLKFLIPQAVNLVAEIDQEFGGDTSGTLTDKKAMSLEVLSSLVKQIEKLDDS